MSEPQPEPPWPPTEPPDPEPPVDPVDPNEEPPVIPGPQFYPGDVTPDARDYA